MPSPLKIITDAGLPLITATTTTIDSVPAMDIVVWLVCLWAVVGIADRILRFWKEHLKEKPDPRTSYAPIGVVREMRDELSQKHTEILDRLQSLKDDFETRQTHATRARKEIHKDIEGVRVKLASLEATLKIYEHREALRQIQKKSQ